MPALTPVERNAFSELANRLTARLRGPKDKPEQLDDGAPAAAEPPKPEVSAANPVAAPNEREPRGPREPAALRTPAADQRPILDRLPIGVLVYRLDKLIYANRAFLDWTGYDQLHALEEAGGLDALFVEPNADDARRRQRRASRSPSPPIKAIRCRWRRGCSPRRGRANPRWC